MTAITSFSGEYRFLSNFWPSPIEVGSVVFPTVEHAYQAAKFSRDLSDRGQRQAAFARLPTPGMAKREGRGIKLRADWDRVKLPIMRGLIALKFFENDLLIHLLCATGERELIEGNSWRDTYWGVCNGIGQNNLGKLLMREREHYHQKLAAAA